MLCQRLKEGTEACFGFCPMLALLTLLLLHDIIQSGSDWPSDVLRHYHIPLISPPVQAQRKPVHKIVIQTLWTYITCLHRTKHVALCYFTAVMVVFFLQQHGFQPSWHPLSCSLNPHGLADLAILLSSEQTRQIWDHELKTLLKETPPNYLHYCRLALLWSYVTEPTSCPGVIS